MKSKILFIFTILLLVLLPLNIGKTYSMWNQVEEQIMLNAQDYSNWYWTGTELISEMSTDFSNFPAIAIDNENNAHVVWVDLEDYAGAGTDWDVFYRFWNSTTESWSDVEVVSTVSTSVSLVPRIAVDEENDIHIVWRDSTDYAGAGTDLDIFYRKKVSETNTWGTTEVISTISTLSSLSPDITVDPFYNIHVVWYDATDYNSSGPDYDIFYRKWTHTLSSWSETVVVSTESTDVSEEPHICSDSIGTVYCVWEDSTDYESAGLDNDIFFKKLTSNGSWSHPSILSYFSSTVSIDPAIDCNSVGDISVVWTDYQQELDSGTDADIYHISYNSNSEQWSSRDLVSVLSTSASLTPDVVIDSTGNIHVGYHDASDLGGSQTDTDIHYKRKDYTTQMWSDIGIISGGSNTGQSWHTVLGIDNEGYMYSLWQDTTNYYGAGTDWDIFFMKFVGPPNTPVLASFSPNPDSIGEINVDWSDSLGATIFHIYREEFYIWTLTGLDPIATVSTNNFTDTINDTGTYHYSIVAQNEYGVSDSSNIQSIVILEETSQYGFFEALRIGEILVLAAIIGGIQIILSALTYSLLKASKPKSGKKKK